MRDAFTLLHGCVLTLGFTLRRGFALRREFMLQRALILRCGFVLRRGFVWLSWLVATASCSRTDEAAPRATLNVFAAASLTEAFGEIERRFEAQQPGLNVVVSTAGSQVLRVQIEQGARADVFASADERHVAALAATGSLDYDQVFATNGLVVIVPVQNPASVDRFEDLSRAEKIVLGTTSVPVGAYADQLLQRAASELGNEFAEQVQSHVVSRESNVRLVRAKVESGEADAAIVYQSDVNAKVRSVPIPSRLNIRVKYSIGRTTRSSNPEQALEFIRFVRSAEGREVLSGYGLEGTP